MSWNPSSMNWGPQYPAGAQTDFIPNYGLAPSEPLPVGLQFSPSQTANFGQLSPAAPSGGGFMDLFRGALPSYSDKGQMTGQGWGGMALGAANGIFNAYMGLKQYGLAKDQFAESKRQFGLNYDAQRLTTNSALSDRQAARVASNPGAYQSVGDYMKINGIPGG